MAIPDLTTRTVAPIQIETALGMPVAIVCDVSAGYDMAGKVALLRLHDPVPLDPAVPAWQIDSVTNFGDMLVMGQQIQAHVNSGVDGGGGVLYGSLSLARYNYAFEVGPFGLEGGTVDADWRINGQWDLDPAEGMVGPQPAGPTIIAFDGFTVSFRLVTPAYFDSYIETVLALEPVGYWPLSDRSGATAKSAVDSPAQDGAYTGVTIADILGPDGLNPAPGFDGTNDFADIYSAALEAVMPKDAGSLQLWLRVRNSAVWPDAAYMDPYYFKWDGNNYLLFSKVGGAAAINFPYLSATIKASGVTFFRDVTTEPVGWFHVVLTWDHTAAEASDNMVLYLNGVFLDQRSLTVDNVGTVLDQSSVIIGANNNFNGSRTWDGWLAHGAVFDRVLTPAEVASLYVTPPAPITYTETVLSLGPIAYWPLNERAGSTAFDLVDSAQNGSYGGAIVLANTVGPDGVNDAPLFPGGVTPVNIYSAALAGVFNGDEGSISVWFKVEDAGVWLDGVRNTVIALGADTSNEIDIEQTAADNQLIMRRVGGGLTDSVTQVVGPQVGWIHIVITWSVSADSMSYYVNNSGLFFGGAGLSSFVGALNSNRCAVGGYFGTGARNFEGWIAHAALFDFALSSDEVSSLYIPQAPVTADSYVEKVLQEGPIAYWVLNESVGTTAVDLVDSAQNGSYGAGVALSAIVGPDGVNGAPLFDGTATGVNIYSSTFAGVFNGDEGSLSVWFQVQNAGVWADGVRGTVIGLGADTSNEYDVEKGLTANQLITRRRAGGSLASRTWTPGPSVKWMHVVITWSVLSDELFFYLDNVQVSSGGGLQSFVGSLDSNRCALASYLGTGDRNFKGYVAHAAVFDYALTSVQVAALSDPNP